MLKVSRYCTNAQAILCWLDVQPILQLLPLCVACTKINNIMWSRTPRMSGCLVLRSKSVNLNSGSNKLRDSGCTRAFEDIKLFRRTICVLREFLFDMMHPCVVLTFANVFSDFNARTFLTGLLLTFSRSKRVINAFIFLNLTWRRMGMHKVVQLQFRYPAAAAAKIHKLDLQIRGVHSWSTLKQPLAHIPFNRADTWPQAVIPRWPPEIVDILPCTNSLI